MGASTKKKAKLNSIGEKGIGFKSCFLVSSRPHIQSNGYRFKLDEAKHPQLGFGMIIPSWVEKRLTLPKSVESEANGEKLSCLMFPLKSGKVLLLPN